MHPLKGASLGIKIKLIMFGFTQEQVDEKVRVAVEEARKTERTVLDREREDRKRSEESLKASHEIEKNKLIAENLIKVQQKEFELTHIADERVKKADDDRVAAETDLKVAQKENEMLHKIVDDRADVLEIKDLVNKLLDKVPEIKIDTLSVQQKGGGDNAKPKQ